MDEYSALVGQFMFLQVFRSLQYEETLIMGIKSVYAERMAWCTKYYPNAEFYHVTYPKYDSTHGLLQYFVRFKDLGARVHYTLTHGVPDSMIEDYT